VLRAAHPIIYARRRCSPAEWPSRAQRTRATSSIGDTPVRATSQMRGLRDYRHRLGTRASAPSRAALWTRSPPAACLTCRRRKSRSPSSVQAGQAPPRRRSRDLPPSHRIARVAEISHCGKGSSDNTEAGSRPASWAKRSRTGAPGRVPSLPIPAVRSTAVIRDLIARLATGLEPADREPFLLAAEQPWPPCLRKVWAGREVQATSGEARAARPVATHATKA
jgi:hypothetical protein